MKTIHSTVVITAIVALIVGFGAGHFSAGFAGAKRLPSSFAAGGYQMRGGGNTAFMRGGPNGAGFLTGTVAKEDSGSITLNTRDGSSHVVLLTPETTVAKSVTGSISDVSVGANVMVSGSTNSDGSLSATNIQLRPATAQTPQ